MSKKIYIKTYGCQMNVYDSVRMADVMAPHGYEETQLLDEADLVVLNTCHIREKAAEKVYSELGRLRVLKQARQAKGADMLLAVGGCVGQAEGEQILKRAPYVDIVMGSQAYHHLPRLVAETQVQQRGVVSLDFPEVQKFDLLPETARRQGSAAYVSVQEGCDKFCTFCVVPYTRGAEYSRPVADVEAEVRQHVLEHGAVEVTLLGQNVNAYHGADAAGRSVSLAGLIRRLAEIDGLERIRYTTSHPRDMQEDLIAAHGEVPTLMPYLHLPIQAGSDRILKAMNRKHTAAEYLDIIERLRAVRPDMAFSSDFIVGFPGEMEADFNDTMRLVEAVGYASAYSFKYSPRPGTPAAEAADQVPEEDKVRRLALLQGLLNRQQAAFNQRCVGLTLPVLLEKPGRHDGQMVGRSPYMQAVHVEAAASYADQVVSLEIVAASANSLTGQMSTQVAA